MKRLLCRVSGPISIPRTAESEKPSAAWVQVMGQPVVRLFRQPPATLVGLEKELETQGKEGGAG